jgi:hypothetical protein
MNDREHLERLVGRKLLETFEGEERLFRIEGLLTRGAKRGVLSANYLWPTNWGDLINVRIEPPEFSLQRTPLFGISWDTRWTMRNDPTTKKDLSLERELIKWIIREKRISMVEGECLAVDSDRCVRLCEEPLIRDCRQCLVPRSTWESMLTSAGRNWVSRGENVGETNRDIGFRAKVTTENREDEIHISHFGGTFNTFPGGRWVLEKK